MKLPVYLYSVTLIDFIKNIPLFVLSEIDVFRWVTAVNNNYDVRFSHRVSKPTNILTDPVNFLFSRFSKSFHN